MNMKVCRPIVKIQTERDYTEIFHIRKGDQHICLDIIVYTVCPLQIRPNIQSSTL